MFERFTDRARRVVVLAQEEARRLNHNYIGTEHILLGLIQEGEGHAAKALDELNINIDSVRVRSCRNYWRRAAVSEWTYSIYTSRKKSFRTFIERSFTIRPQLHRHRTYSFGSY